MGYITLNEKGVILEANHTFTMMLGLENEALIKKPLSAFIVEEDKG